MIKKFTEIARAWITAINPSPEEAKIAESRLSICNSCEHRKKNTDIIGFYYCGICKCPLEKKIFAQDKTSCPENKWVK